MTSMKKIPFSRLLAYLILACLTPLFAVGFFYFKERNQWEDVSLHIQAVAHQGQMKECRQSLNNVVRKMHAEIDHDYLGRIEQLALLSKEKAALEALFASRSFTGSESAEMRYAYICGDENRLLFANKDVQKSDNICETLETLVHPVEVDHADLQKILSLIEETHPKQPQLFITDFKLNKKTKADGNEVFELHCAFIKREFEK